MNGNGGHIQWSKIIGWVLASVLTLTVWMGFEILKQVNERQDRLETTVQQIQLLLVEREREFLRQMVPMDRNSENITEIKNRIEKIEDKLDRKK